MQHAADVAEQRESGAIDEGGRQKQCQGLRRLLLAAHDSFCCCCSLLEAEVHIQAISSRSPTHLFF